MATKTKASFVRITIDPELDNAINLIKAEYPLLSTAEAVKLILSKGLKQPKRSIGQILSGWKTTNPVQLDLSEDEMFAEWEKFNQSL